MSLYDYMLMDFMNLPGAEALPMHSNLQISVRFHLKNSKAGEHRTGCNIENVRFLHSFPYFFLTSAANILYTSGRNDDHFERFMPAGCLRGKYPAFCALYSALCTFLPMQNSPSMAIHEKGCFFSYFISGSGNRERTGHTWRCH